MKIQLGKLEISIENGKVSIKVSQSIGGISALVDLDRNEAIKLRNYLNKYINGELE
jgi:hypothetical protein